MNFIRSKFGKVYIHSYDPVSQRGKFLPRSETRHLDPLSDLDIWEFIHTKMAEKVVDELPYTSTSEAVASVLPSKVVFDFERWLEHLEERGLDIQTIRQHRRLGTKFVLEYFGRVGREPDPNLWPQHTARLYSWLTTAASSMHQVKLINTCLRKFYRWMIEENIVTGTDFKLRPPPLAVTKPQLEQKLSPDELLVWAKSCSNPTIKFIGLASYFFSLRPQEVGALRPIDFRTGAETKALECVAVMERSGLSSGLVLYVGRQKQTLGTIKNNAKKGSNGWVACFDKRGARLIVDLLRGTEPTCEVAKWNITKLYDDWKKFGPKGFTMKDMRRASLHWLGQNSELQPLHLMKHARHRSIETTMIYCQRPEEKLRDVDPKTFKLELDD